MAAIVATRSGRLEGVEEHGVLAFRGIPFARPPVGPLRFLAPEPPEPWSGVRRADRFGPAAPQAAPVQTLIRRLIGASGETQSEDCLYLNVWTPAADRRRRPVLVWIHGGGFVMGASSTFLYTGERLARRGDVVVVTLNYRLGAFGFLNLRGALGDAEAPANAGLADQIAALRWVGENVEAFGGDPENVTVFGESAGGMSVATLLGVRPARGLFRRAIAQSGAAHNVSSAEQGAAVADRFLHEAGLPRDLEALRRAPVAELLRAQRATTLGLDLQLGILAWQPSVDGDLLPELPLAAVGGGASSGVDLLVGTNRDEWKLFMLGDSKGRRLDEDGLRRRMARGLADGGGGGLLERALALYRRVGPGRRGELPSERWSVFQTDRIFQVPALELAAAHAKHAPDTFLYRFDWTPPLLADPVGACHGIEIPFVFGTLEVPLLRATLGLTSGARALSARMQDAWIAFARAGHPGHERLPEWPRFAPGRAGAMLFARACRTEDAPLDAERHRFWREVLDGEARRAA